MKRVLKIAGYFLAGLGVLLVIALVAVYFLSNSKINKTYTVDVESITVPTDAEAVARGEYIATSFGGCTHCHGDTFAGDKVIDGGFMLGRLYGPNLTTGQGGVGEFTDEDWLRAIRHGVGTDGKGLVIMPSHDFQKLTEADMGALLAFLKSLPPQDNEVPSQRWGLVFRAVLLFDSALIPAIDMDQNAPFPEAVEIGVTPEYGRYIASISCWNCHGEDMSGGPAVGGQGPKPANLTKGGELPNYSEEAFRAALWTGIKANGERMDDENMPWTVYAKLTAEDTQALWLYLQSLPATEFNGGE